MSSRCGVILDDWPICPPSTFHIVHKNGFVWSRILDLKVHFSWSRIMTTRIWLQVLLCLWWLLLVSLTLGGMIIMGWWLVSWSVGVMVFCWRSLCRALAGLTLLLLAQRSRHCLSLRISFMLLRPCWETPHGTCWRAMLVELDCVCNVCRNQVLPQVVTLTCGTIRSSQKKLCCS